jgi:hypothetical protein
LSPLSAAGRENRTLIRVAWESSEEADYFHAFVAGYARGVFTTGTTDKIVLASQELVENALRYSLLTRPIVYELSTSSSEVRVSVENATIATRAGMLQDQLRRIERDPEGTYTTELERSMSGAGRRSMLGLCRIWHEANMRVSASVVGSDVVVIASCRR